MPVSYRAWGAEDGAPVLYLHHLGVAGASLHPHEVASVLATRGYRRRGARPARVRPDAADGRGALPAGRAGRPAARACSTGSGSSAPRVIGFSWGGSLAVHVAGRGHPSGSPRWCCSTPGTSTPVPTGRPAQPLELLVEEGRDVIDQVYTFASVDEAVEAQRAGPGAGRRTSKPPGATPSRLRSTGARIPTLASGDLRRRLLGLPGAAAEPRAGRPRRGEDAGAAAPRGPARGAAAPERAASRRRSPSRCRRRSCAGSRTTATTWWPEEIGPPLGDELADWLAGAGWRWGQAPDSEPVSK